MRFESYTLPVIALAIFIGVFSVNASSFINLNEDGVISKNITKKLKSDIFSPQVASVVKSIDNDSALSALFSFNEGAGVTLLDRSQYGAVGILHGNPIWSDGVDGSALYFNGVDDYASIKDNPAINTPHSFTLASWVMPDEISGGTVLSKDGQGVSEGSLYTISVSQGKMHFSANNSITLSTSEVGIKPQQWSYTAVTYDSETKPNTKLYVNGRHVLSSNIPSIALGANTADLFIGRDSVGNYFKGRIDEIRVYSKALSASEIIKLFNAGETKIVEQQQAEKDKVSINNRESIFTSFFKKIISILKSGG